MKARKFVEEVKRKVKRSPVKECLHGGKRGIPKNEQDKHSKSTVKKEKGGKHVKKTKRETERYKNKYNTIRLCN